MALPINLPESTDAESCWRSLQALRNTLEVRWEEYAAVTLPNLFVRLGHTQFEEEYRFDFQSVGAQATNYLANKLMFTMFRPGQPFIRLEPDQKLQAQLPQLGITPDELTESLAGLERQAVKALDTRAARPKLFEATKNLIVLGNVCMDLSDKNRMRVHSLKNYVVRRFHDGRVAQAVLHQRLRFDQLDKRVQDLVNTREDGFQADSQVSMYRWIKFVDGMYRLTTWINDRLVDDPVYRGQYRPEDLPFHFLTWSLRDGDDYGAGLVENYHGDFKALSELSQGMVQGALLACEYRWMINPGGMTKATDITDTRNGAAIPGDPKDVQLLNNATVSNSVNVAQEVAQEYIQRIGRGFLLSSVVTRDAERVTAEEIRQQAQELEGTLGGVYTRLAQDMQQPIAMWLMRDLGLKAALGGSSLQPVIVTGLDALSRSADLDNLKAFLGDISQVATVMQNPMLTNQLSLPGIMRQLAAGYGLDLQQVLNPNPPSQAEMMAQQQAQQPQQPGSAPPQNQ